MALADALRPLEIPFFSFHSWAEGTLGTDAGGESTNVSGEVIPTAYLKRHP